MPRSALLYTKIEILEPAYHFGPEMECSERKNEAAAKNEFCNSPAGIYFCVWQEPCIAQCAQLPPHVDLPSFFCRTR